MNKERIRELVRNFPQNGMMLLLETPANVRDLLRLVGPQFVDLIDFDRMAAEPSHFVARDFRHVEADIVLRAPIRKERGAQRKQVLVYVLIEHQSEPDALMSLRLLDYVTQIYKAQGRDWARTHPRFANFRLQPVLPVVLYTGERPWPEVGTLAGLMDLGEMFASVTPAFTPLYFNLPAASETEMREEGRAFGAMLRLYRERNADLESFRDRLAEVVREIEALPRAKRLRWLELLSYIHAFVYHDREESEHPELSKIVEASAATDEERRALMAVKQTMAQCLQEKGSISFGKETLLLQLRLRFGDLPVEVTNRVQSTENLKLLRAWLGRVTTAKTLNDIGILRQASSRG